MSIKKDLKKIGKFMKNISKTVVNSIDDITKKCEDSSDDETTMTDNAVNTASHLYNTTKQYYNIVNNPMYMMDQPTPMDQPTQATMNQRAIIHQQIIPGNITPAVKQPATIDQQPILVEQKIIIKTIVQTVPTELTEERSRRARQLETYTLPKLKEICAERGILRTGTKDDIIRRLMLSES